MLRFDFDDGDARQRTNYAIEFARAATTEIDSTVAWYKERSPQFAAKWYRGLVDKIFELVSQPVSHPVTNDIRPAKYAARRMLYRQGSTAYYVYYSVIEPDTDGGQGTIRILRVRNAVMRPLRQAQVEDIDESDEL